jgi:hypothetical protein
MNYGFSSLQDLLPGFGRAFFWFLGAVFDFPLGKLGVSGAIYCNFRAFC